MREDIEKRKLERNSEILQNVLRNCAETMETLKLARQLLKASAPVQAQTKVAPSTARASVRDF